MIARWLVVVEAVLLAVFVGRCLRLDRERADAVTERDIWHGSVDRLLAEKYSTPRR